VKVYPTTLPEVLLLEAPVYSDHRGFFTEVFHAEKFAHLGLPTTFVQDNHSRSARHVLRGLHYQVHEPQGKLVSAVRGRIFDVAVDVRRASPSFGRWTGVELEAGDGRQLWIPAGFAHGFLVLSEDADVSYKCTAPYRAAGDRAIRWDDPALAITWPLPPDVTPHLAAKDAAAPLLADAELQP
jgi:dTDP-4-dehydrorhamnose 3,5-epimerase